jgi:hypothetical protein
MLPQAENKPEMHCDCVALEELVLELVVVLLLVLLVLLLVLYYSSWGSIIGGSIIGGSITSISMY